jgi:hypothetical protein
MRFGDLLIATPGLAGCLAVIAVSPAAAQEYCVECTQPNAIYRCVLENAKPGVVPSLQMHCISVLAKEGQHGTCSIKRGTVFECAGPIKRVPVVAAPGGVLPALIPAPQGGAPQVATPQGAPSQVPPQQDQKAPAPVVLLPPPAGPPQTVKELAERSAQKTGAQSKKSGEAVKQTTEKATEATGSAFGKTWACVSSFFTKC